MVSLERVIATRPLEANGNFLTQADAEPRILEGGLMWFGGLCFGGLGFRVYRDNGKSNGTYYNGDYIGLYWDNGIMEKKMETTIMGII